VSSTYFEHPSVHPQEDLYGTVHAALWHFFHTSIYAVWSMVELTMNTWMVETCRRHYN